MKDLKDGDPFRPKPDTCRGTIHRYVYMPIGSGASRDLIPQQNFLFVLSEEISEDKVAYRITQVHKDHACFVCFRADEISANLKPLEENLYDHEVPQPD